MLNENADASVGDISGYIQAKEVIWLAFCVALGNDSIILLIAILTQTLTLVLIPTRALIVAPTLRQSEGS